MGPHMPQKKKKTIGGSIHALFVLRVSMGAHHPLEIVFCVTLKKSGRERALSKEKITNGLTCSHAIRNASIQKGVVSVCYTSNPGRMLSCQAKKRT
mmetsp:Transcript_14087/g.20585  ORF Transcript_14087/g.20585 Transcript_14087/m.20585 type:complete len:96 (+) Transcript_14087:391-678(+)